MSTTHHTGSEGSAPGSAGSERPGREGYNRTRRDFEGMSLEDQATFWVEATAALVARGVREAGEVLAREVDGFFEGARGPASGDPESDDDAPGGPGPAEPETGQQRAPRSGGASDA